MCLSVSLSLSSITRNLYCAPLVQTITCSKTQLIPLGLLPQSANSYFHQVHCKTASFLNMLFWWYCRFLWLYRRKSSASFILQYRTSVIYQVLYPLLHYFFFLHYFSSMALSSLILSYLSILLTTNATSYNRLLQSLMFEVVMYWITLLTLLVSVCTIHLSHVFSDGNASLILLFSTSLILNSIACCSSVRFLSCNSCPLIVPSDSAASMLSSLVSPLYSPVQSHSNLHKIYCQRCLFRTIQCTLHQLILD